MPIRNCRFQPSQWQGVQMKLALPFLCTCNQFASPRVFITPVFKACSFLSCFSHPPARILVTGVGSPSVSSPFVVGRNVLGKSHTLTCTHTHTPSWEAREVPGYLFLGFISYTSECVCGHMPLFRSLYNYRKARNRNGWERMGKKVLQVPVAQQRKALSQV